MFSISTRQSSRGIFFLSALLSLGLLLLLSLMVLSFWGQSANGEFWSGEDRVTDAETYAGAPAAGIDSEDNIYLVWEEEIEDLGVKKVRIHFMKMSPTGEIIVNTTIADAYVLDSAWPDIAVEENGTAHIVWQDYDFVINTIYYMCIGSDGEPIIPGIPVVQETFGSYTPSVAVDSSGYVHIVWLDVRLTSRGTDSEIFYTELDPSLAEARVEPVTDENIRIIDDTQISDNLMIMDILSYLEWITGITVLEYPPMPDVVVDPSDHVHVVWTDARDGNPEIYYSHLDPSQAPGDGSSVDASLISIVSNKRLTYDQSLSLQPMIASGPDGMIHLAFTDNRSGSFEVYYSRIEQEWFGEEHIITRKISGEDPSPSGLTPIFVDRKGNIYITWRDRSMTDFEVYLSKLTPSGIPVWDNIRISHSESGVGGAPIIVDSNLNPIIFWQDNRTQNFQVYFNRTLHFPDLAVGDVHTDGIGSTFSHVYAMIHNHGNMDTSTEVRMYSPDTQMSLNTTIPAGSMIEVAFPWTPESGAYILEICVDPNDEITEIAEGNNIHIVEFEVPDPPEIFLETTLISTGEITTILLDGGAFTTHIPEPHSWLNVTVLNSGGSPTGDLNILVEGTSSTSGFDPLQFSTWINLSENTEEMLSFTIGNISGLWHFSINIDPGNDLPANWKIIDSMNFSLDFIAASDPHIDRLHLSGERKPDDEILISVVLANPGVVSAIGSLVVEIDGELLETRYLELQGNSQTEEHFSWQATKGDHTITARLVVEPDRDPGNNEMSLETSISEQSGMQVEPIVIAGTTVIILFGALVALTESGRYSFLKFFFLPLYTRIKKGKVLDHFLRGQVYGFIKANPGAHYNLIRKKLDINNGALAYHISVLEREKFIRSRMDGTLKRFYPADMNVPSGHELTEMERRLIEFIRANPGFSQKDISNTLGLSPQVVNYHIKSLARNHHLKLTRVGKKTLCYYNENSEIDS